jgi:hypothetical protein
MVTQEQKPLTEKIENMTGNVAGVNSDDAASNAREFGKRVQSKAKEVSGAIRNGVQQIDEATIPEVFRKMPKLISPKVHAWLDVAVTGYFAALGVWFALRRKRRPSTAAFVNASMVAGVSLLTDYEGTGRKPINFKLHGTLDAVQAVKAALAPLLYDFADEPEAAFFYGQAANEFAVIGVTDWDQGVQTASGRKDG